MRSLVKQKCKLAPFNLAHPVYRASCRTRLSRQTV